MKILLWGLTEETLLCGYLLNNKEFAKEVEFIGSYDINAENKEKMINPVTLDKIKELSPEIILSTKRIVESVKRRAQQEGLIAEVVDVVEFINKELVYSPKAYGTGLSFGRWLLSAIKYCSVSLENVFEIGSNYSQDANISRLCLGISSDRVYCFEANPFIAKEAQTLYDFNTYNIAVSNIDGTVELHLVDPNNSNSGISTVIDYERTKEWDTVTVECTRMDTFFKMHPEITSIDLLKIDVEGLNYEVLEGFGDYLKKVKCIQVEAEFINYHEKYCFKDIVRLLYDNGFELVDYKAYWRQNDSLWVRRDLLNTIPVY